MANIERKTYTVDVSNKVLGRAATDIARHLMGKTSPSFQSHIDAGDLVIVKNVKKLVVTGKKAEQKVYRHHTARPGGLRTKKFADVWEQDPAEVLRQAVSRMLPKNKHRTPRMLRLTIE